MCGRRAPRLRETCLMRWCRPRPSTISSITPRNKHMKRRSTARADTADLPTPVARIARPHIPDEEKKILLPLDIRLKAFDPLLTPPVREQIQVEFKDYLGKPEFPMLVGNRLVDLVCATCLADRPVAEAQRMLGHQYMQRYWNTLMGRFLMMAAPLVDVEWVLRGLPRQFSAATNFGIYWVAELAPRYWRFDFEDDPGLPDYILGTLLAGGEILKVRGLQIAYKII